MNKTKREEKICPWCKGIAIKRTTEMGTGGSFFCYVCTMCV